MSRIQADGGSLGGDPRVILDCQAALFLGAQGAPGGTLLRVLLAVRGLRLVRLVLFMQVPSGFHIPRLFCPACCAELCNG